MSRFNPVQRWWIALALLVLMACGLTGGPQFGKVAVRMLETDILFGARQAPASPKPPELPPQPQIPALQLPMFSFGTYSLPLQGACPTAGATTFPAEVATTTPNAMPSPGAYRWRVDGGEQLFLFGHLVTVSIAGQDMPVYVRNPKLLATPTNGLPGTAQSLDYTYETIWNATSTGGGYLVYKWQVKSNGTSVTENSIVSAPSPAPNSVSASDPEAGITLEEIDSYDSRFQNETVVFAPKPTGLLLLPLPASTGTTWTSTATDPTTGAATFQGSTGTRVRVDACGQLIEGWEATGRLTLTGTFGSVNSSNPTGGNPTSPPQADLEIVAAPQYGGLIVQFKIDGTWFGGLQFVKTTIRDGQLTPDPLPKQYQ